MKQLIAIATSLLLVATLGVGCDDETADEAPDSQQAQQQGQDDDQDDIGDQGQVVDQQDDDDMPFGLQEGTQWLENDDYGIKVQVPDDWQITEDGEAVIASDPTGSTTAVISGSDADETVQDAVDDLELIRDIEIEDMDHTMLEGIPAQQGSGSAVEVREDDINREIQFLGWALNTGGDYDVVLMIYSEAAMYEAMRDTIHGIAGTVREI